MGTGARLKPWSWPLTSGGWCIGCPCISHGVFGPKWDFEQCREAPKVRSAVPKFTSRILEGLVVCRGSVEPRNGIGCAKG
jgi:hypothetical protein